MAERANVQVSKARVNEILANKQANYILQLQQEVAQLTAVNEALWERLNGDGGETSNTPAQVREAINDSPNGQTTP